MGYLYPELLSDCATANENRARNASILLHTVCHLKAGETVAILQYAAEDNRHGPNRLDCHTLARTAAEMGAFPFIIDLEEYHGLPRWKENVGIPPLIACLQKADVVLGTATIFKRLGCGEHDSFDKFLIGNLRWFDLQRGFDVWNITPEEIETCRRVTLELRALLQTSREIRVTSPAGTDFTCSGMEFRQILGIVPCYGEVAVTPKIGSGRGIVVADGPIQNNIRPASEIDREPLVVHAENGRVTEVKGDGEQVARFWAYVNSMEQRGISFDEVGIPTTRMESNNACWADGTHNCHTLHIAVGNNELRSDLVHGKLHADMEIRNPTLYIDGKVVMKDDRFLL